MRNVAPQILALVLLLGVGCGGHPQAFDYESRSVEGVPTLVWDGDAMTRVEVLLEVNDGEPIWAIECVETTLCIRSPVFMGFTPEDVDEEGTLGDVIEPGNYFWQLTGASTAGTWTSAPVAFEVVEEVAVPDGPLTEDTLLLTILRRLGLVSDLE